MAEASAMANIAETRAAAQKAVDYCTEIHQTGEGSDKLAWRYHPKMEADTSVTGWFVMALKSAKVAGLHVNHASFDGAIKYLDSVEHKAQGGDPGYAPPSTYWYTVKDAHEPHRLTAIGCLCRQFLGWKKEDLQASVEGFVAKGGVPNWGGNGQGVDLYYWYYGTLCVSPSRGGQLWKEWNAAMSTSLTTNSKAAKMATTPAVGIPSARTRPNGAASARPPSAACVWKCTTATSSSRRTSNN